MVLLKKSSEIAKIRGENTLEEIIKKLAVNDERVMKVLETAVTGLTVIANSVKDAGKEDMDKMYKVLNALTQLKEAELARSQETASIADMMKMLDEAINSGNVADSLSDIAKTQKENQDASWKFDITRDSKGFAKVIIGSKV